MSGKFLLYTIQTTTFFVCAGIADGLQMHQSSLPASVWQHAVGTLLQMLASSDLEAGELQLAAVASIGRLLLHAGDACDEQGQTEQLLAALVQTYIEPTSGPESSLAVT